jgi:hypothetical protein
VSRYVPGTYKNHRATRLLARFVIFLLLLALVLAVSLFFGLRQYIVYTPDGLRLEIPWLEVDGN